MAVEEPRTNNSTGPQFRPRRVDALQDTGARCLLPASQKIFIVLAFIGTSRSISFYLLRLVGWISYPAVLCSAFQTLVILEKQTVSFFALANQTIDTDF